MEIKSITKLFFWKKSGKKELPKMEEMLQTFIKYIPEIRKVIQAEQKKANEEMGIRRWDDESSLLKRMYDFYADAEGDTMENPRFNHLTGEPLALPADSRIDKKPMEVAAELERAPIKINLTNLDEKINLFKSKSKLVGQRFSNEQIKGFTQRLLNRKHYEAHHKFYESFPFTTDDKIDDLLGKYKLVMKVSDLFVPTFPKEAIDVMEKYTEETKKFTDEAPVFYVIAEEDDFKQKRKKLDPILLVQSPFGFYWQILGAWDKEMLLLSEL